MSCYVVWTRNMFALCILECDLSAMKRQSKRQGLRQRAEYQIRRDGLSRQLIPESEVRDMLTSVVNHQIAPFGLVKLGALDLNCIYSTELGPRTLIEFSACLKRDAITAALLRAGADPSISQFNAIQHDPNQSVSQIVRHLWSLPPAFACWIVRICVSRRNQRSLDTPSTPCQICQSTRALKMNCGHCTCESCFWRHSVMSAKPFDEIRCPVQQCTSEIVPEDQDVASTSIQDIQIQSAISIKQQSLEKWLLLPTDLPPQHRHDKSTSVLTEEFDSNRDIFANSRQADTVKKPKFCALPRSKLASLFVGTIRPQRCVELERAAEIGDVLRLQAVVHAGVDIDFRNEYGQTALIVAAWRRHIGCIEFLLKCGADPAIVDNAGIGPLQLAHGHEDLLSVFGFHEPPGSILIPEPVYPSLSQSVSLLPSMSKPSYQPAFASDESGATLHILIGPHVQHAGAGSYLIDGAFDDEFLQRLINLHSGLPRAIETKATCSQRSYYCDATGWVSAAIEAALNRARKLIEELVGSNIAPSRALPHMRFLNYVDVGGNLPAHIDLSRTDVNGHSSTHTFILYLSDCVEGGETVLLKSLQGNQSKEHCEVDFPLPITPRRGRLLMFPHNCPHEGAACVTVPKLLLRGELL